MDTAARYKGDQFVIVLPETGSQAARQVAQRITAASRNDREEASVFLSMGAAIFPHDGKTISELLTAADHALFREKRCSKRLSVAGQVSHIAD
jgi:diguanylate cyclase (GGDEF)-like protein